MIVIIIIIIVVVVDRLQEFGSGAGRTGRDQFSDGGAPANGRHVSASSSTSAAAAAAAAAATATAAAESVDIAKSTGNCDVDGSEEKPAAGRATSFCVGMQLDAVVEQQPPDSPLQGDQMRRRCRGIWPVCTAARTTIGVDVSLCTRYQPVDRLLPPPL